jgi:sugar phosphate isomerase/epimerase
MQLHQVAAQLYTCRELCKTPADLARTLKRLRGVGYTAVQVSGICALPEAELHAMIEGEGLVCCATHEPGATIINEPAKVIDRLLKLGCRYTAYPYPAGVDFSSRESVDTLIKQLDESGARLAEAGLTLCYHNHNHEFRKVDGETVYDLIFKQSAAANLKAEIDTYWIHYGGGDVVDWCERLHGRLPLIHLKDYMTTAENSPTYCEIGAGQLNFKRIIAAAEKSGCEWFIVEQDVCPGDPVDSLAQSFEYIRNNLIS